MNDHIMQRMFERALPERPDGGPWEMALAAALDVMLAVRDEESNRVGPSRSAVVGWRKQIEECQRVADDYRRALEMEAHDGH